MVPTIPRMYRIQFRCLDPSLWIRHSFVRRDVLVHPKEMLDREIQLHRLLFCHTLAHEIWRPVWGKRLPLRANECSDRVSVLQGWTYSELWVTQGETTNYRNCYSFHSWVQIYQMQLKPNLNTFLNSEWHLDRHEIAVERCNQFEFVDFKLERQFRLRTSTDVL